MTIRYGYFCVVYFMLVVILWNAQMDMIVHYFNNFVSMSYLVITVI